MWQIQNLRSFSTWKPNYRKEGVAQNKPIVGAKTKQPNEKINLH